MSRPRKPQRARQKPKAISEQLARDAVAHESAASGDKVKLVLQVTLSRRQAERLAAKAIRESRNRDDLVAEILEATPLELAE
jgi:hypothetical protein